MPLHDLVTTLGALMVTIVLLVVARPMLKRFATRGTGTSGRLHLTASLSLDRTRRLCLVDIDGQSALILTGGNADHILPWPRSGFETALAATASGQVATS